MTDCTPTKTCSKCGNEYPATREFFHANKTLKDGLVSACKSCVLAYQKTHYKDNRDKKVEYQKAYREGNLEAISITKARYYRRNREQILKAGRDYYHRTKVRDKDKRIAYRRRPEVRDRTRQRAQKHYHENKQEYIERAKQWGIKNPENKRESARKYTNRNRQKIRKYYKLWQSNNREIGRIKSSRYRGRKRNLLDTFTADDWRFALEYFNGCCAVCGRQLNDLFGERTAAMDHWIPLSSPDCPGTIPTNIVPLCHGVDGCNNSKHDKGPTEWLEWKFGKRKARKVLKRIERYFTVISE